MSRWLSMLCSELSTDKYYILYRGSLSNHLSHAVIALHKLGASDQMIAEVVKHQVKKLESSHGQTAMDQKAQQGSFDAELGQRRHYYVLVSHYKNLLMRSHSNSLDSLIQSELPKLYPGMICSALHGLIHTGYGLSVEIPQIVCEGLAYLHHSNVPLLGNYNKVGNGSLELVKVLDMIRGDEGLRRFAVEEVLKDWVLEKGLTRFQNLCLVLVTLKGDILSGYADSVSFPSNEDTSRWLLRSILQLFCMSDVKCDFFFLHGVTATWSLCEIVKRIEDKDLVSKMCQAHMCILLAVYIARGCPTLSSNDKVNLSRKELLSSVLDLPPDTDEHVFKLVHVCMDIMEKNCEDVELQQLCLYASHLCLNNKLII